MLMSDYLCDIIQRSQFECCISNFAFYPYYIFEILKGKRYRIDKEIQKRRGNLWEKRILKKNLKTCRLKRNW